MTDPVLLVEDDGAIAQVIATALEDEGFAVIRCADIATRDALLAERRYSVMLTDVVLGDGDGIATLDAVRVRAPGLPVVVVSAQNTLDTAVRASETGAFEYLPKPFDLDELVRVVRQAAGDAATGGGDRRDAAPGAEAGDGLPLVGRSAAMQQVFRLIARVLRNDLTVLVLGESGTGKELVAEAIHQLGARAAGPFVAVNAAAIPADLIESELFGHEKGAFTGAVARSTGKFEQADGGTLFLDEIGDMPPQAQTRLLRALQSGRIRRVGGRADIAVDVRIIAATNRDLAPLIAAGAFREDLFYRLNVIPIELPPLRERQQDIPMLARHFLALAERDGLPRRRLSDRALTQLARRAWPGNVRELRNAVLRLAVLARSEVIDTGDLADVLGPAGSGQAGASAGSAGAPADLGAALAAWIAKAQPAAGTLYHEAVAALEQPLFEYALDQTGGNQLRAAQLLGINRNTLRKKLDELAIVPERFAGRR